MVSQPLRKLAHPRDWPPHSQQHLQATPRPSSGAPPQAAAQPIQPLIAKSPPTITPQVFPKPTPPTPTTAPTPTAWLDQASPATAAVPPTALGGTARAPTIAVPTAPMPTQPPTPTPPPVVSPGPATTLAPTAQPVLPPQPVGPPPPPPADIQWPSLTTVPDTLNSSVGNNLIWLTNSFSERADLRAALQAHYAPWDPCSFLSIFDAI